MCYVYVRQNACIDSMRRWDAALMRMCHTRGAQCWGLGSVTRCVARHVRVLLPPLWQARVCAPPLLCGAER